MKYYSMISSPMITCVFLVCYVMFITLNSQKISLVLGVRDVFSSEILLERKDVGFMTRKLGIFL